MSDHTMCYRCLHLSHFRKRGSHLIVFETLPESRSFIKSKSLPKRLHLVSYGLSIRRNIGQNKSGTVILKVIPSRRICGASVHIKQRGIINNKL